MTKEMSNEQAIEVLEKERAYMMSHGGDVQVVALDMAIKSLEQQPSDDCVSRQAVDHLCFEYLKPNTDDNIAFYEHFCDLPPVTPAHCIAAVRFSKEDLREICNERIEIECTHGTCKDCKYNVKNTKTTTMCDIGHRFYMREPSTFYCADFEKRGSENEVN